MKFEQRQCSSANDIRHFLQIEKITRSKILFIGDIRNQSKKDKLHPHHTLKANFGTIFISRHHLASHDTAPHKAKQTLTESAVAQRSITAPLGDQHCHSDSQHCRLQHHFLCAVGAVSVAD